MASLTGRIKTEAYRLGFCGVGVARAERLTQEAVRLREWLDRGYHGTMRWMENNLEKRTDPGVIMPGARSVVALALNYYTDIEHSQDAKAGKISRYAWGDDYHDVLSEKLATLLDCIRTWEPAVVGKIYVDTGPMMEKVWAQRAGIGWEGKHTNVITQDHGSWVFLGELILNLELEYDGPATDHCGSCTLCIEACPTQAIVEPYVLDSNLCISYLTIEHRGAIAGELGEHFDRWIYGCDVCQDVCPWNHKFAAVTSLQQFAPRPHTEAPDITEVSRMTQEEFSAKFKNSPIKRTRLSGLKRNAETVLKGQSV